MTKMTMTKRQQFWLRHVQEATKRGQGLKQYASAHRLSVAALYNAKSVFKRAGLLKTASGERAPTVFVPVQIAPSQPLIRCRLQHLSGWQLEMERLPDPSWLRAVIWEDRDAAA